MAKCDRQIQERDGFELVQQLMEKLNTQVLRETFSVARYVWLWWNGFVFCSGFTAPKQLVAQAREAR